jgi:acyl carrier protein
MTTLEQVTKTLAAQLNIKPETVKPESDIIADLKADSLDVVEMLMTLEEQFSITVPEADAQKLKTVNDLVAFIDKEKK